MREEERAVAMGKGKKSLQASAAETSAKAKRRDKDREKKPWLPPEETEDIGCGCPHGCVVGGAVDQSSPAKGSIQLECSGKDCPARPGWVHSECVERLEDFLVKSMVGSKKGGARDWEPSLARSNLWRDRGYDHIYRLTQCPQPNCKGYRRKDPGALPAGQEFQPKQAVKKPRRPSASLPKPNLGQRCSLGKPSKWVASPDGPTRYSQSKQYQNQWEEEEEEEEKDWDSSTAPHTATTREAWGQGRQSGAASPPSPSPAQAVMNKEEEGREFLASLEALVVAEGGRLWEASPELNQILSEASPELMESLADEGGLNFWLLGKSEKLRIRQGSLCHLPLHPVPSQHRGFAVCVSQQPNSLHHSDHSARDHLVFKASSSGQSLYLDRDTEMVGPWPEPRDVVEYLAEEASLEKSPSQCRYRILSAKMVEKAPAKPAGVVRPLPQEPRKVDAAAASSRRVESVAPRPVPPPVIPELEASEAEAWGSAALLRPNHLLSPEELRRWTATPKARKRPTYKVPQPSKETSLVGSAAGKALSVMEHNSWEDWEPGSDDWESSLKANDNPPPIKAKGGQVDTTTTQPWPLKDAKPRTTKKPPATSESASTVPANPLCPTSSPSPHPQPQPKISVDRNKFSLAHHFDDDFL